MPLGEDTSPVKKRKSRMRGGGYLGIVVSILCLVWVLRSVDIDQVVAHVTRADVPLLLLAILVTFCSYLIRSWRWQFFFASNKPRFPDAFRCLIMGFFVNNLLPARVGELVRAHLGGRATKQSRSIVLATVAGERLADGLAISVLFSVLFCLGATPAELDGARELTYVAVMFLVAAMGTAGVLVMRARIFRLLERLGEIMPGTLSSFTLSRIERFIVGLEPLLVASRLLILGLLSVIVWSTELVVYYIVTQAFHYEMSIGGLALFLAAVNFSSLIPAGPGAFGVIEAFATLILVRIGVQRETGLSMVVTQHLIQYITIALPGCYFLFLRMGGRIPQAEQESDGDEDLNSDEKYTDISGPRPDTEEQGLGPACFKNGHHRSIDSPAEVDLSIIVPAFNEEHRLPNTILEILEYLKGRDLSFEILVVDDGSTDGTAEVIQRFSALSPSVRLLTYPTNKGKGYAVRFGVMNSVGEHVLFDDADGATPIVEVERLEAAIREGAEVAIGSRALFSRETAVSTLWYRKALGRVFSAMVNVILLPGIADTQCGFKLFRRKVALRLFQEQREKRYAFDVEILFLARIMGCRIAEVPVNWTNVPGSKVNVPRDSILMFIALWRIRMRKIFGAYSKVNEQVQGLDASKDSVAQSSRPLER